jgi:hypothetical protein
MALSEIKVIDKIEVIEDGTLQVREVTRIIKDDQEIAKTYHRWAFAPGSDVSSFPSNVQSIAQAAWTSEIIAAYEAKLQKTKAE